MPPHALQPKAYCTNPSLFSLSYLHRHVSPQETLVVKGRTTWARNGRWILPENARLLRNIQGSFTCRKSTTWDRRLYFPSEGRRAEDFFSLKNPTANLGTKGQQATSIPPKPLKHRALFMTLGLLHFPCFTYSITATTMTSHRPLFQQDHAVGCWSIPDKWLFYFIHRATF